jgi:hypothetical protein
LPPLDGRALWFNLSAMSTTIGGFLCPSDGPSPVAGYGRVNYRFSVGPTPWFAPGDDAPDSLSGPFSVHMVYHAADFRDGLSQTVGSSEKLLGDWLDSRFSSKRDYVLTNIGDQRHLGGADWASRACAGIAGASSIHESKSGETWFISCLHATLYNHINTPNSVAPDCSLTPFNSTMHARAGHDGVFDAKSHHLNGVSCMMMDGSVRFIPNSVDLRVWRALATRSGGDFISID